MKRLGFVLLCFEISVLIHNYTYHRALSEVPTSKAIAGVRVGLVGDKFIINPTTKEMEDSELDLLIAGTDSGILMIEVSFSSFFYWLSIYQSVYVFLDVCMHLPSS